MTSGSKLSSSESIALKAISGVGLAIFTALMVVHWNHVLSKVQTAEETAPQTATTTTIPPSTPSTTTNAAAAPPVPSTSGVAPSATSTSAIATDSTTATPATPASSATAPTTTTTTAPESSTAATATTTATAPITSTPTTPASSATTTTSTPVETAPAEPSSLAAVESTPAVTTPDPATASSSSFTPDQLETLEVKLYDTLDKGWTEYPSFGQDLVYKVTVDADGNIVNYQPLHGAAIDYLNETPLDEITPNDTATGADFVVVLTPTGVLEVDSWIGK